MWAAGSCGPRLAARYPHSPQPPWIQLNHPHFVLPFNRRHLCPPAHPAAQGGAGCGGRRAACHQRTRAAPPGPALPGGGQAHLSAATSQPLWLLQQRQQQQQPDAVAGCSLRLALLPVAVRPRHCILRMRAVVPVCIAIEGPLATSMLRALGVRMNARGGAEGKSMIAGRSHENKRDKHGKAALAKWLVKVLHTKCCVSR